MRTATLAAAILAFAPAAFAQEAAPASDAAPPQSGDADNTQGGTGALVNRDGQQVGNVSVSVAPSGDSLVLVNAEGFPEGTYAMHLHMVGRCDGPDFESAGEHIAAPEGEPGQRHGVLVEGGPHPGDLPNVSVQTDGTFVADGFAQGLTLDMVFDEDGSALIVHAQPDDYASQPGGNAGAPIACAVVEPASATMTDETVDAGDAQPADELGTTDAQQQEQAVQEGGTTPDQGGEQPAEGATDQPAEGATGSGG